MKQFTREQVAEIGKDRNQPLLIIRNKVYNVASWLQDHPGGEEVLLQNAGMDCTKDYEAIQHSEPAQALRENYLVGELVAQDQITYDELAKKSSVPGASLSGNNGGSSSMTSEAILAVLVALYAQKAWTASPIPAVTYNALLRHAHLLMSVGAVGSIGSVTMAVNSEGESRKTWMDTHKSLGVVMAAGLAVRIWARMTSTIPPRFKSSEALEQVETASHYAAYALLGLLPASGLAYGYFSGTGAPLPVVGEGAIPGKASPNESDMRSAKQAVDFHKLVGKFFKFVFIPFHVGIAIQHFNNGRDVVRKISPFI